jgi:hypothetical protein
LGGNLVIGRAARLRAALEKLILERPEKVPFQESFPGSTFEVFLKVASGLLVSESNIDNQVPRFELPGVRGLACIMVREPLLEIGGDADVVMALIVYAFDQVDVSHGDKGVHVFTLVSAVSL